MIKIGYDFQQAINILKKWIDFSSKEIVGIKPLRVKSSVNRYEQLVCMEFERSKQDLKKLTFNNIARMAMIYLAYNYCGLTLKVIGQKYGGISDSAVNKVVSRFRACLSTDKKLQRRINRIVSSSEM